MRARRRRSVLLAVCGVAFALGLVPFGRIRALIALDATTPTQQALLQSLDTVSSYYASCAECAGRQPIVNAGLSWIFLGAGEAEKDLHVEALRPSASSARATPPEVGVIALDKASTIAAMGEVQRLSLRPTAGAPFGVQPPCWNQRLEAALAFDDAQPTCPKAPARLDADLFYSACTTASSYSALFPTSVLERRVSFVQTGLRLEGPSQLTFLCANTCRGTGTCISEETYFWTAATRAPQAATPADTAACLVIPPKLPRVRYAGVLEGDVCHVPFRALGLAAAPTGDVYRAYQAHDPAKAQWRSLAEVRAAGEGVSDASIAMRLVLVGLHNLDAATGPTRHYVCRTGGKVGVMLSSDLRCFTGDGDAGSDTFDVLAIDG